MLKALESRGYLEDAVVIFTSDHGDSLGDHGLIQKWSMYDCVTRVPLLIWSLYRTRHHTPVLSAAGLAIVTLALTVAVGQWVGWMAGVAHVAALVRY